MTMLISAAGALVVIPAILRAFGVRFLGRSTGD